MERLVSLRKRLHLTQKQVAEGTGLTTVAIQNYESGRRKPAYDVLIALADFFHVPVDYLLGRGVFANWEQIIKYRDFICEKLQPKVPFARVESEGQEPKTTQIDLKSLDEKDFMLMLSAMVERIEIIEKDGKLISFTCFLLPMWLPDPAKKTSD